MNNETSLPLTFLLLNNTPVDVNMSSNGNIRVTYQQTEEDTSKARYASTPAEKVQTSTGAKLCTKKTYSSRVQDQHGNYATRTWLAQNPQDDPWSSLARFNGQHEDNTNDRTVDSFRKEG